MRLTPAKVKQLAELVALSLEENPEVDVKIKAEDLRATIAKIMTEDLREEEEIEDEARRTLEQHREQIRRTGANFDEMLRKSVRKLAQDRGFTL